MQARSAGRRAVIWALAGPQQARYDLLDDRLFCAYLCIAIFGVNIRICRSAGVPKIGNQVRVLPVQRVDEGPG